MRPRGRAALELAAPAAGAVLYLTLLPRRPVLLDAGLALLAGALLAVAGRRAEPAWLGEPAHPVQARRRRAWRHLMAPTAAVALLFAVLGAWLAWREGGGVGARLLRPTFPLALALFVPWAALQQALLLRYVLPRLRGALPGAGPGPIAGLAGLLFGLVHLPAADLTAVTVLGGAAWSWLYLRDRLLAPIAVSHALLGTAYFYWMRGEDLAARWLASLAARGEP